MSDCLVCVVQFDGMQVALRLYLCMRIYAESCGMAGSSTLTLYIFNSGSGTIMDKEEWYMAQSYFLYSFCCSYLHDSSHTPWHASSLSVRHNVRGV